MKTNNITLVAREDRTQRHKQNKPCTLLIGDRKTELKTNKISNICHSGEHLEDQTEDLRLQSV